MKQSTRNYRNAWGYFVVIGEIPKDAKYKEWRLVHRDAALKYSDRARYDEWRVEDLVPVRAEYRDNWRPSGDSTRANHQNAWLHFVQAGQIPPGARKNEWCLHHVDMSLKKEDPERYSEWRVEDLVAMKKSDHMKLHARERSPMSYETKAKISASLMGHEVSEEARAKISAAQKGKKVPEEAIKKRLETYRANYPPKPEKEKGPDGRKGLLWINDGVMNGRIRTGDPLPEGWTFGRLGFVRKSSPKLGPMSEDHKQKISAARTGMKFTEEHCRHLSEAHKKTSL